MTLILVRHGETDSNAKRIVQVPETPLNSRGLAQAEAVGQRLARALSGQKVRIISSDLARAAMTAHAISDALEKPIESQPLLQERNFGDLRGRAYADIGLDIMAPGYAPPGGETWEAFDQRVAAAWQALVAELAGPETVIAVSHGLVCRSLATHHFGLAPDSDPPLHWGNTSVTIVEKRPPHRVSVLNCTRHLDSLTADGGQISGI